MPVVLDASTAIYSLHLERRRLAASTIRDAADRPVTLQVVGLLKNSVLQGNLLVSEANFLRVVSRYGRLSVLLDRAKSGTIACRNASSRTSDGRHAECACYIGIARSRDDGFDVVDAREQLAAVPGGAEHLSLDVSKSWRAGVVAGHGRPRRRAVAERAGTAGRTGADAGRRLSRAAGWCGWWSGRTPCCCWADWRSGCIAAAVALIPQWAPQGASVPWLTLGRAAGHDCGRRLVGRLAGDAFGAAGADSCRRCEATSWLVGARGYSRSRRKRCSA